MRAWLDGLLPGEAHWGLPLGLLALVLPLAVLLASMRPSAPAPRYTGTFRLWRGLESSHTGTRRRLRPPLARSLWILALTLGALALGQPRPGSQPPRQRLVVVLDGSPSMGLPHPDGGTRRDRAVARLARWLDEQPGPVRLEGPGGQELDLERLPASGLEAGADWQAYDRPGYLWLTDRTPEPLPTSAGLAASGGPAVPGPVGARGRDRLWWDGQDVELRRDAGPAGELVLRGPVPPALESLARLWAEQRGWAVRGGGGDLPPARGARLVLEATAGAPAGRPREPRELRGAGWSWSVLASGGTPPGARGTGGTGGTRGASSHLGGALWSEPGRLWLGFTAEGGPGGDPGAFVSRWVERFEAAAAPAPQVLPLAERTAAGSPRFLPPSPQALGAGGSTAPQAPTWTTALAALAAGLGLGALALSGWGRRL